jgi:serine phosphatase RsbU (regulator of sigma subunit)
LAKTADRLEETAFAADDGQAEDTEGLAGIALIARVASLASSSLALQKVCERALAGLREHMRDLLFGGVYILDDQGGLTTLATYRRDDSLESSPRHAPDAVALVRNGYHLITHEGGGRADEGHDDDERWVSLAIERRGEVMGVLELGLRGRGTFDQEEIRLYHGIAAILGNAVGNARSYEAEVRNARMAEGTGIILGAALRAASEEDLMRDCLRVAESLTESEQGFVIVARSERELHDTASNERGLLQVADSADGCAPERHGRELWELAVRSRETVMANDPARLAEVVPTAAASGRLKALMATPLMGMRGHVMGTLVLGNRPGGYSVAERAAAEALAPIIVEAIERFRAEQELAENARFADELNHIEAIIHASLEFDTVAEEALRTGLEALTADTAALSLYEPPNFRVAYATGFPEEVCGHLIPERLESHSVHAIETGRPVLVEDVTNDERVDKGHMLSYGVRAVMAIPLIFGGKAFGVAYYNFARTRRFSEAEVRFAMRLSLSLSLAMENARLYETERTISNRLQEALLSLPTSVPGVDFAHAYYPATDSAKVGGDFYDIFELSYGNVGITIGDVAGKGIDAAALTSLVKNTIRAHAAERGKTPAQVLRLTNEVLYKTTPIESFVTVFFGILDCRDGRLVCANGGHTAAAILRPGGEVVKLPVTGPLLGALEEVELEHVDTRLEVGDALFLYTDGLTEARRSGELYGEERLFRALAEANERRPRKLMQRVVADLMAYSRGVLRDDLAILSVCRTAGGPDRPSQQKLAV